MRFVHWLMSDGRWFYRGSHRAAAEPVSLESLFSPEPAFFSAEPGTAPQPITLADEFIPAEPPTVEVTFTLPREVGAADVLLCGDFNGWTSAPTPLAQGNDGAWQVTLPLEPGNSYHYRYLLDGQRWENAWQADRYEPNPFGSDNSVVIVDWPELA
ncbi:MAG TPA: isoamylase early set domain-containing protein, partial [Streptosporangiaceae bacterium]|nr:isoamylase early set domain-containing protein [Streptosporangiaceae bacterium]